MTQNVFLPTIVLEGTDEGVSPGTFLPEDLVTVTSPTLGLSGSWQITQIQRDFAKPTSYVQLQLNGLVRELLLHEDQQRRIIHDLAVTA